LGGSTVLAFLIARITAVTHVSPPRSSDDVTTAAQAGQAAQSPASTMAELGAPSFGLPTGRPRRRILVVDDDAGLRLLLRTTLTADEFAVEEAGSAEEAADMARFLRPEVVILDIGLPGMDGLAFCRELKDNPAYEQPLVMLLTGAETRPEDTERAGADAVLRKPFSPLELVMLLDRVSGPASDVLAEPTEHDAGQLMLYARDLGMLLEVERTHRRLLQQGYRQIAIALADALEAKDPLTGLHALRVQRYALELTGAFDRSLLDDPSLEYGFLLHDVGKIGIPDSVLQKDGPLTASERRLMQEHTLVGVQILSNVAPLHGEGLRVVRSHHERWDGKGYPDRLAGGQIPIGARIFALVDALDAMTSERPYRRALTWDAAADEILAQNGTQFDPRVVAAFAGREQRMRTIAEELAEQAA
jgi:response regulator RpfG family c-di-GMP phosphodiesterase